MNVTISEFVEIQMRNTNDYDRKRIGWWIDYLKKWDTDPSVRKYAKKLEMDDVYMLVTNSDFRIFFALKEDGQGRASSGSRSKR